MRVQSPRSLRGHRGTAGPAEQRWDRPPRPRYHSRHSSSTAIAAFVGDAGGRLVVRLPLQLIAGLVFIALGAWLVGSHVFR